MVRRHNKRVHNGKDRHTGRKIPKRSEHEKKVKTRSVGSGRGLSLSLYNADQARFVVTVLEMRWIR